MIENVPLMKSPKLFDRVIGELQQGLKDRLSWLDYSFGRAERLVKTVDGVRVYSPNVYVGNNDYELVTPDTVKIGNYSFFVMEEPQEVASPLHDNVRIKSQFSLIVWLDMRTISDDDERNTEAVKEEILLALEDIILRKGRFEVTRIYERAENVFAGFTLDEVDNQYMMAPYYGVRIQGTITITNDCVL